ncbi:ret finger protein-like 4A [Peromyscus leucopus]|uniref:ret finger protein-like 4A n=1 Tax=Peromyscus leucopus TaxID=10041 RepID=UPI001884CB5D|nr:ret finger protein-like 4A [Peromyscus leucopus]
MAHFFKERSTCPFCQRYLERPMYLKCGYVCCLRCIDSLEKIPKTGGTLCPNCSVVSLKEDILPAFVLGRLTAKIKELEESQSCSKNEPQDEDISRSVYFGSKKQDRKECAERFQITTCVLGSSRFTAGRHYWEVVVGTSKEWDIGVCKESVDRQVPVALSDKQGFWTVGVREGNVYAASTEPLTELSVNPRLHRVGIFLDLQEKQVSFWDLSDGSHIFTFFEISESDAYRPLFIPANSCPDDQEETLTICPVTHPGIFGPPVNP